MKKFKRIACIGTLVSIIAIGSWSFADDYFEISKNLDIFATLYKEINLSYVDETDPGQLIKTGIDAMLKSLDPYTNYIPESQIEDFRFMTTGQYGGIGSLIRRKGKHVVIAEPYEGFPAHKAGLMAGDIILEVNGKSTLNKTTDEMSKILKGEPKTILKMKIQRDGIDKPFFKELSREEIKINDVPYHGILKDNIGYIKLNGFTETASREVKAAFKELKGQNIQGLIFDLRGNGGGLLREAVNIVNIFVEKGQEVVHTSGKTQDWDRSHKTLSEPLDTEIPLVVLINSGSASASEIVAGTIQDLDRGVLIGQKSFGKGLVQQTKNLSYNSKIKLTVAKYYIPSGRCIQKINYSSRNKAGKAQVVPDSLIQKFKTKGGRTVVDGEGVTPDIDVSPRELNNISLSLMSKSIFFDYATVYRRKTEEIAEAKAFHLTDSEYDDFIQFISDKEYDYSTRSENVLKKFTEATKEESYYEDMEKEIKLLTDMLKQKKSDDISTHKSEIELLLENEIISRYYFQKGRLIASLYRDNEVAKAIEILNNMEDYTSILTAGTEVDKK